MHHYNLLGVLHSNLEPIGGEARIIRRSLLAVTEALNVIKYESRFSSDRPEAWAHALDVLHERKEAYSIMLSPIRRVPLEIWAEIFKHEPLDAFVFSQVCRTWRHAALYCPKLWTTVMIDLCNDHLEEEYTAKFISNWIARSASLGISMCFFYEHQFKSKNIQTTLDSVPGKERWKNVYTGPLCIRPLFDGQNMASWNMLEELIIDATNSFFDPIFDTGPVSLMSLGSLKRLSVSVKDRVTPRALLAPWSQLTYLHLDSLCSEMLDYLEIIHQCVNLEQCLLFLEGISPPAPLVPPSFSRDRVPLPKLRSLLLNGGDNISPVLSYLKLPALEFLSLSARRCRKFTFPDTHTPGCDIASLVKASRCNLRRLELHTISIGMDDVRTCFQPLNSLRELKITNLGFHPPLNVAFMKEMEMSTYDPKKVLLPNLTCIEINSPSDVLSFHALQGLIASRTSEAPSYVSRLDHASLTHDRNSFPFSSSSTFDALSPFASSLQDYGINLQVTYF